MSNSPESTEVKSKLAKTSENAIEESKQESNDTKVASENETDSSIPEEDHAEIVEREGRDPSQTNEDTESLRQLVIWKVGGFFDFNPRYFIQIRGLANLMHIGLSITDITLLGLICQLRPYPDSSSEGFYCKPPETFLFVLSCCSFFTAVLYFFCCVLSKTTDFLLFQSSFEVCYFITYFILLLTASLILLVSEMNWELSGKDLYESDKNSIDIAAVIGLLNCAVYGLSAIWFFVSHYKQTGSVIEVPEW